MDQAPSHTCLSGQVYLLCQDRSLQLDPDLPLLAELKQPPLDHGELPEGQAGKGDEDLGGGERDAQKKLVEIEAEAGILGDLVSEKFKECKRETSDQ